MEELIRWYDYLLFLLAYIFILLVGKRYAKKRLAIRDRTLFLWGIALKMLASFAYVHLYVYYYKYGDTIRFYRFGQYYKSLLSDISNLSFFQWVFMKNDLFKELVRHKVDYAYGWANSSFFINKISGFFSLFTFNSFLLNSVLFGLLAFTGLWYMYQAYSKLYPKLYKEFAMGILFFPSIVFWGSGIMKDTIAIGAVGFMTASFVQLFVAKKKSGWHSNLKHIFVFFFFAFITFKVKSYQLVAFMPGMLLWLFYNYRDKIQSNFLRKTITPMLLVIVGFLVVFGLQFFAEELDKYALDNVLDTALALSYNLSRLDAGSAYDLGPMSPTITGLLSKFPAAVNVTLFRPYLWEVNNVVMILAAVESTLLLLIFIRIIFKIGVFKSFSNIFASGILVFSISFTLIFAFATGISSQNFGSLVRYKIPLMPFFITGIFILYYNVFNTSFIDDLRNRKNK